MTVEIHPKIWGEERWIVNRPQYCGKILILKKSFQCSLHHHLIKDETFYVTKGLVFLELEGMTKILRPGMAQHIPPMARHRFTGLEDSEIIEFSSRHYEEDSYRDEPSRELDKHEFSTLLTACEVFHGGIEPENRSKAA